MAGGRRRDEGPETVDSWTRRRVWGGNAENEFMAGFVDTLFGGSDHGTTYDSSTIAAPSISICA